jgi:long-subunit fatty acid transport protein
VTPQLRALFGVGWDEAAIAAQNRSARLPDTNRLLASFGFIYEINKNLQANFAYQHLFSNGTTINELATTAAGGLLQGSYTLSANLISASAVMKF